MHPADAQVRLLLSTRDSRFNPNHSKTTGQFTSNKGGGGGYTPGAWGEPLSYEARVDRVESMLRDELSADVLAKVEAKPGGLNAMATDMVDRTPGTTYVNGEHTVTFGESHTTFVGAKTTPQQQQQFLSDVDKFQTQFPVKGRLNIRIDPSSTFGFGVGGETLIGSGSMRINLKLFNPATGGTRWHTGMPAADLPRVTAVRYVLAHEWGHAIDNQPWPRNPSREQIADRSKGMSSYGKSSPHEGFAEAFAEWSLTKGTTTNEAARAYADQFGWADRWPK